jgi:DNA-binding transcriptional MerR regulator
MDKQYYRSKEVEEELGISYQTLRLERLKLGIVPVRFPGAKGTFYSAQDVTLIRQLREQPWLFTGSELLPV